MRSAGILLPIASLPSKYGIGSLGQSAFDFIDFLSKAGQKLWQILPIGHTGYGDSPYQSFSAFAGNPYFIDLDILIKNELLLKKETDENWGQSENKVDYRLLYNKRYKVLRNAISRFSKELQEYKEFCMKNSFWLNDYACFMTIKGLNHDASLFKWSQDVRHRDNSAMSLIAEKYYDHIEFWKCLQFLFFQQWGKLKKYANAQDISIVGDIPIYISSDSCDLWANPELYQLDKEQNLAAVAGVPPDAFTSDGQLWGNPLYDWEVHKRDNYSWWLTRLEFASELFDITRIDHFRGFASYYSIPSKDKTAKNGKWVKGPGYNFIKAMHKDLPNMKIIAEDLGYLTEDVHYLLKKSNYPGMKILQFAFDSREQSDYLPYNYTNNSVVYTGTHDNATTKEWIKEANANDISFAMKYLGVSKKSDILKAMVRVALGCVSETAIIPMQDYLGLGKEGRINTPGTLGKNWSWRLLQNQLSSFLANQIYEYTKIYGRL